LACHVRKSGIIVPLPQGNKKGKKEQKNKIFSFSIYHFPFVICHLFAPDAMTNGKWKMINGKCFISRLTS
jgi:hypothetical protein